MIYTDFHMHSAFSGDAKVPMEHMIASAIEKGLTTICFTEHNDYDYPPQIDMPQNPFLLDVPSYVKELSILKEQNAANIDVRLGIEIGLKDSCVEKNKALAASADFDFILASAHLCADLDPYYPAAWEEKDPAAFLVQYLKETLAGIQAFDNFDVLAHLDYILRYCPVPLSVSDCTDAWDLTEEILKELIIKGKGLECNTSGLRKPYGKTNPSADIIRRYRELGGEIVSIGSDAHRAEDIGAHLDVAGQMLLDCGFKHYGIYKNRQVEMISLPL